tara:strand:+ start:161 stop:370 length:210 start_codon:yes stop_codon:yes gene_type:complete
MAKIYYITRTGSKRVVYITKSGAKYIKNKNSKRYLTDKQIKESHKRNSKKNPKKKKAKKGTVKFSLWGG